MPNVKISNLPPATLPLTGGEQVPVVQGGATKRTSILSMLPAINVMAYGATGNGIADDTTAINNALAAAKTANAVVVFPPGIYLVSGVIVVDNGVRGLRGEGGQILFTTSTATILLRGKQSGQASNVVYCAIENLRIDANNQGITGGNRAVILGENVQFCSFINNTIINVNWAAGKGGIWLRSYLAGTSFTIYNQIVSNVITGSNFATIAQTENGPCVAIDVLNSELNITPYASPTAYWKATFTAAGATWYGQWNVIADNVLEGGYYGIDLSAAQYTSITGNVIRSNVRSISAQNVCQYNNITGNTIINNISSAIHFAYGSRDNLVDANNIQTGVAVGEATLNAYVGCPANTFSNNHIRITGGFAPQYFAYCGVQSSRCAFVNNTFFGRTERASIGVESAWNNTTTNPASYAYLKAAGDVNGFAGSSTTGVRIHGNIINNDNPVPAIFTNQVSDGAGNYALTECSIIGNMVANSNPNFQLEMAEDNAGSSNSHRLIDNSFFPSEDGIGFYSWARGRAMFSVVEGNSPVNGNISVYEYPNGTAQPNVAYNDYVSLAAYTTPTTVTNFTGANPGQIITVRLANVVTIENNANIVLKNNVNLVGTSSNDFLILLRRDASTWVEIGRSLYSANADNAATQQTSRTTTVVNNAVRGQITLFSAAGTTTPTTFTLTNSFIGVLDTVVVNQRSGTDRYVILVTNISAGSCQITFYTTGGTTTEQPIFQFSVIKNAVLN